MLLIMCNCSEKRYAIDARHVREVLPRVNLQHLAGSPAWLAGALIYRGQAIAVIDLTQLTEGKPCPNRLSSRIMVLQVDREGTARPFGLLAERVGLRELPGDPVGSSGETAGLATLGRLCLDEQGIYQLIDISRLLSDDRQTVLFPSAEPCR